MSYTICVILCDIFFCKPYSFLGQAYACVSLNSMSAYQLCVSEFVLVLHDRRVYGVYGLCLYVFMIAVCVYVCL